MELEAVLTGSAKSHPKYAVTEIARETLQVQMRDGTRLATDLYLPPKRPAPAILVRTPYGRRTSWPEICTGLARCGYVIVAQDCRGTGDSEPDTWEYYVFEREDTHDSIEWVIRQSWYGDFLAACGGSYLAELQWCMSLHPRMSAIAPEVGGLGIGFHTARHHMFLNAYARSVGKGRSNNNVSYQALEQDMLQETLDGGYFNEPLYPPFSDGLLEKYPALRSLPPAEARRWLWTQYCTLASKDRAELIKRALSASAVTIEEIEALPGVFGHRVAHDAHMFPTANCTELCRALHAAPLVITGWYDWGLNDALATWQLLMEEARDPVRSQARLLITPNAHSGPGYHEGAHEHPALNQNYRTAGITELLLHWYETVRNSKVKDWPVVTYYLMGANEWRTGDAWPPIDAHSVALYLSRVGILSSEPAQSLRSDEYVYDPEHPTPTIGGSIVSFVYPQGSVDVSMLQRRDDVLTYSTDPLEIPCDVVGAIRLTVYVSSTAIDTDFCARLSDVFPDGRAIQLQAGLLRARYRTPDGEPELLVPGCIYCLEIDMWATANRFQAGHRLRLDISSSDFPKFNRHSNRAGESGGPIKARQTIYHGPDHPSRLVLSVLGTRPLKLRPTRIERFARPHSSVSPQRKPS